jgi:hypothetical protein
MGFYFMAELYIQLMVSFDYCKEDKQIRPDEESTSANVSPQIKTYTSRYFQSIDVSLAPIRFPVSSTANNARQCRYLEQ